MGDKITPILGRDRIISLDIIRGFALLGIFMVNMPSFFSPILYADPAAYWTGNVDKSLHALVEIFAQASFYPLFAFLFGFGAVMIAERMQEREQSFPVYFSRRLFVLLLFGLLHAFFVWHGDILITYALCGIVFLLFYRLSPMVLLSIGASVYLFFFGLLTLSTLLMDQTMMVEFMYNADAVKRSEAVYGTGSFGDIFSQRFQDWYLVNGPANFWLLLVNIVPFMLTGAAFAKKKWLTSVRENRRFLWITAIVTGVFGMLLKSLPYIVPEDLLPLTMTFVQDYFGGPLLALFYVTAMVLLLERKSVLRLLKPLSYAGRMSISNYLLQSILCTALFYAYGLGLYGSFSYLQGFMLVCAVFAVQLFISRLWLKRFAYGPVEYIWRYASYGRKPMEKTKKGMSA